MYITVAGEGATQFQLLGPPFPPFCNDPQVYFSKGLLVMVHKDVTIYFHYATV